MTRPIEMFLKKGEKYKKTIVQKIEENEDMIERKFRLDDEIMSPTQAQFEDDSDNEVDLETR